MKYFMRDGKLYRLDFPAKETEVTDKDEQFSALLFVVEALRSDVNDLMRFVY